MDDGVLKGCVRKLHHVRARDRSALEAAREVRVEDVEPARAEAELERLDVDEDLVPVRNGARQPWIRHARPPVDLEPDEAVLPLADRGDAPAAEAKHPAPRPRARASRP